VNRWIGTCRERGVPDYGFGICMAVMRTGVNQSLVNQVAQAAIAKTIVVSIDQIAT